MTEMERCKFLALRSGIFESPAAWVSRCLYRETAIAEYQSANDPARPLDSLSTSKQNGVITEICKQIEIEEAANRWRPRIAAVRV